MNPLKKGPEIKLSELKVPDFLLDLYYELRERRLLPLVVVLAVAIVAVPIALSESVEPPGPATGVPELNGGPAKASDIVVAKSTPGLRDYRRRLQHLKAKNPFKQQFAAAEEAGVAEEVSPAASGGGGGVQNAPVESSAPPVPSPESEGGGGPSTEGGGGAGAEARAKYYSSVIDVRVVPVSSNGKKSKAEPYVLQEQPPLTMLPGRDTPALVYIGPTKDGKKALVLVSSSVKSAFGDNACVLGGETCQMMALETDAPETLVYGGNERVFRIELRKIERIVTDEVNEAALGQPGKDKGKSGRLPDRSPAPAVSQAQPK